VTSLPEYVAAALDARAAQLAAHWQERAWAATPRQDAPPPTAPEDVVRALAAGLSEDARPAGEVMRLGWDIGTAAHAASLSVTHVQRDADLLLAVLLAECERVLVDRPTADPPVAALALARRLQRLSAQYAQAAVAGFLQAQRAAVRAHWRTLRHDLRNPIGTIQSALALMDDEALPIESRQHPRMRAMLSRNAGTLAQIVTDGLDDRAVGSALAGAQAVSLRAVAHAARREVRGVADAAGCEIDVTPLPDDPSATVEPATLELALTALLLAGLARARAGDVLRVERPADDASVLLRVARVAGGAAEAESTGERWEPRGLTLAAALLAQAGGRLAVPGGGGRAVPPASLIDAPALQVVLPPARAPQPAGAGGAG
jgi:signal transduction histidine kinase